MESVLFGIIVLGLIAAAWFGGMKYQRDKYRREKGPNLPHQ